MLNKGKPYRSNLMDLVGEIDWISINTMRPQRNPDSIVCSFVKTPSDIKRGRTRVKLAIGRNVVEAMGWKMNDLLGVFHSPDDVFKLRIAYRPNIEKGYRLKKPSSSAATQITFPWPHMNIPLPQDKKSFIVEFLNYKNSYLVLDINPDHYKDEVDDPQSFDE